VPKHPQLLLSHVTLQPWPFARLSRFRHRPTAQRSAVRLVLLLRILYTHDYYYIKNKRAARTFELFFFLALNFRFEKYFFVLFFLWAFRADGQLNAKGVG
jgi:hypothetical protein